MRLTAWEETVARTSLFPQAGIGVGCLLQIYPLNISSPLIELAHRQTFVGRDDGCTISVTDASVSRQHALIERVGDQYVVTDLDSTNGTFVDEQRVQSAQLRSGDRVQFGGYIYKFLSTNHIELQYHEAMYSMMTRDGLTGALNKRSLLDIMTREVRRSMHRGTALSLIVFDIDRFKSVNDTHGHLAGDEVLKEFSQRIGQMIADHDVFARFGGEEFAILLPEVNLADAAIIAERCRAVVAERAFTTSVGTLSVTISAGVAEFDSSTQSSDENDLIAAADAKLYEAKNGGRDRVCA